MAAKKNDPRREARIAKNNRNLNSALTLFTAGFIAEFYLLLINQYFVKGSVDQVVAIAGYLEVMAIVGAAAFGAGVVLTVMRRKWTRFAAAGKWLLGLGLFFGVSSLLMRRVYPMGTTVMCILVPVLMLLAVVFLLYQHEFAVQTIALTLAIASAVLLNHGSSSMPALVTAFCWAAMVLVAALLVLTVMLQKHEGSYKGTVIFPAKTNYALTCAVLVLSIGKISIYARYVRAATIQQLSEDYVLFAISKGASRGYILLRHVLKNCLLPVITLVGMNLGSLVSGAYIVETIFGWPGLGTTGMSAIYSRDYNMIMGTTMLSCLLLVGGNLLADLCYCLADPRIKAMRGDKR